MDARSSHLGGGGRGTVIGVVDGHDIEADEYNHEVSNIEDGYKQQNNTAVDDQSRQQIRDMVWNQTVMNLLVAKQCALLGMEISDKELNDMLAGDDPVDDIRRAFTDRKTGVFDAQAAAQQINQIRNIYRAGPRRGSNADNRQYEVAKSFWEVSVPRYVEQRLDQKFVTLLANSAYVPKWMAEKEIADNSQIASVSYVNNPYIMISDSAVKVSDAEITDYVNQHPDAFRQQDSRSIAYVSFDASPNHSDSDRVRKQLVELSKEFATTKDPGEFLARVGTESGYADTTIAKSMLHVPFKDSIMALPKGALYGPYLDGSNYTVAKMIDEHQVPDSVEARHILVATVDPSTRQPIMDDSTAVKKIDSLRDLIEKGGQRFDSVAAHNSDDGSKTKGGKLGWFGPNQMVKEFQDFAFGHKVGDKGIVKSQFGYHYIEILGQKNFEPGYKVAYLSRKIDASQETDQAANGLASQFAGESRDAKAFEDNVKKDHLQRLVAKNIIPSAIIIPGVGANRQLVQWAYDADLGAVSEPFPVGDKYVVALLVEINKEGIMPASKARETVEPILRSRKKAEMIVKNLGNPATLDAAATAAKQSIQQADSVSFASDDIPRAGKEPKVVGAAFDKSLVGKPVSPPIAGISGVYFIRVEKVGALSNPNSDLQQERFALEQQQRTIAENMMLQQFRRLAKITDNRGKFF
jgi:peptidyl-prolyl cis-trans isomerase D